MLPRRRTPWPSTFRPTRLTARADQRQLRAGDRGSSRPTLAPNQEVRALPYPKHAHHYHQLIMLANLNHSFLRSGVAGLESATERPNKSLRRVSSSAGSRSIPPSHQKFYRFTRWERFQGATLLGELLQPQAIGLGFPKANRRLSPAPSPHFRSRALFPPPCRQDESVGGCVSCATPSIRPFGAGAIQRSLMVVARNLSIEAGLGKAHCWVSSP
ncbi:hypothetical protein GQ53DRAFT_142709 [Thozetella sp. PMI_491]|nr:hypothetical protein GQ53DRAFT_142709 [Thozetella sp. PMI_491]